MKLEYLTDEELLQLWHTETERAEELDEWDAVAAVEEEMIKRGMDPAAEAER